MIKKNNSQSILFFSILNNLRKRIGLYFLSDWELMNNKSCKKNFLNKDTPLIISLPRNYIHLQLRDKIKNSWFFLGIRHEEKQNNIYGYVTINNSIFKQGRVMPPTRIRWRIIHVSKNGNLNLILEEMTKHENIKNIYLFKIPFFTAIRKIHKRVSGESKILIEKKTKPKIKWKIYNQLFSKKYIYKNFKSYSFWLNKLEANLKKNLHQSKFRDLNFSIPEYKKYYFEVANDWIILKMNNNFALSKISKRAISWAIDKEPFTLLLYGDEDYIDKDNKRSQPLFRPSWNQELFLSDPLYCSVWIINKQLWNKIIKEIFSKKNTYEIDPYEIIISCINYVVEKKLEKRIKHLSVILGHNTIKKENNQDNKEMLASYKSNIKNYFRRYKNNKIDIFVDNKSNSLKYYYPIPKDFLLSLIIPTKDNVNILEKCINSLLCKPPGCRVEIIIVNNNSLEKSTYEYFNSIKSVKKQGVDLSVIDYPKKFNYSAINNYAFNFTNGDVIALINNDVEVLTNNWGYIISSYALRLDVGCVGIKLIYPDNTIQHAGIILGIYGSAAYSHKNFNRFDLGHAGRLQKAQEVSAVTGAFLAIKRENWEKLHGLNEEAFPINYNDVDFCLRAKEIGLKNIYIPFVEAIHYESKSRGKPKGKDFRSWQLEYKIFTKKWKKSLISDPAYSPSLTKYKENWSLSFSNETLELR